MTTTPNSPTLEQWKAQPFHVLDDQSYDSIYKALQSGRTDVKSYMGVCPHRNKKLCKCPHSLNNFDEDGCIVAKMTSDGENKPVYSMSELMELRELVLSEYRICEKIEGKRMLVRKLAKRTN
jgi:hypothetical protein